VSFRYDEIGKRLKAFRLASSMSAEEIARSIGISRTALYRFERGELAKIETLEKLADLLGASIPTLLGVGIEFISSSVAYFERLRQIEEECRHVTVLAGPISYLLSSDSFFAVLEQLLTESIVGDEDMTRVRAEVGTILDILRQRKEAFRRRRFPVVNLVSGLEVERMLRSGFVGKAQLPYDVLMQRIELARAEIIYLADLIERAPMRVQIGVARGALPQTGFQIFECDDRKILTLSPFRLGENPNVRVGVAMITSAAEALTLHENAVAEMWKSALKGPEASAYLRSLVATTQTPANVRRLAARSS
jgi:transcriptional regulator with XRE-family HTH domain